jgi:glutamate synthase (ferredoxin)
MMRVCHLNTCPVGVATQNPELRAKFTGDPQHTVNFMKFIAEEVRELMAQLGFRTIEEMVGRTEVLEADQAIDHWKTQGIDLSRLLHQPVTGPEVGRYCSEAQDHGIAKSMDVTKLLDLCAPAIERGEKVTATLPIRNVNRVVGTILGNEITKRHWHGLPDDTVHLKFMGTAGQSFGAFVPKGVTLEIEGDANDYVGKGLSGGRIIVYPPAGSTFAAEENIIAGNTALYGATSGELFLRGMAGERFAVREDFSLKDHLAHSAGEGDTVPVRVWFSAEAMERVRREQVTGLADAKESHGGFEVAFMTFSLEWLAQWLLSFGAKAEALAPPELRTQVRAAAAEVVRLHRK